MEYGFLETWLRKLVWRYLDTESVPLPYIWIPVSIVCGKGWKNQIHKCLLKQLVLAYLGVVFSAIKTSQVSCPVWLSGWSVHKVVSSIPS